MSEDIIDAPENTDMVRKVNGQLSHDRFVDMWNQTDSKLSVEDGAAHVESVLESLKKAASMGQKLSLTCAELLYEVRENKYFEERQDSQGNTYQSFDDFVKEELGLAIRKAYLLAQFYEIFVVDSKVPLEVVSDLPYSKALIARDVINEENWPEVVGKINELSTNDLKRWVKKETPNPDDTRDKRFICMLSNNSWDNVQAAIEFACQDLRTEDKGKALDLMALEFLSSQVGPGPGGKDLVGRLKRILDSAEELFKVEISATVKEEGAILYRDIVDEMEEECEDEEEDIPEKVSEENFDDPDEDSEDGSDDEEDLPELPETDEVFSTPE